MKRKPILIEELLIWLRARFSLTEAEKGWLLLILFICWVGLVGKYFYHQNQKPEPLTPEQVDRLLEEEMIHPQP